MSGVTSSCILLTMLFSFCQNRSIMAKHAAEDTARDVRYKNVIPKWVKDSLSEEGFRLVCRLSEKYEMSYYPMLKQEDAKIVDLDKNQNMIDWLLNASSLGNEKEDTSKMTNRTCCLKSSNSDFGSEDKFALCSQTHTFYSKEWGEGVLYADVSAGYIYDAFQKVATELKAVNVTTNRYFTLDIDWQESSVFGRIVNGGKDLDLHVEGCLKTKVGIEGVVGINLKITSVNQTFRYAVEPGYNDDSLKREVMLK